MKNILRYSIFLIVIVFAACKKTYTERAALDSTTLDNYYNTAEEVRGLTSTLYGLPWSGYETGPWMLLAMLWLVMNLQVVAMTHLL